MGIPGPRSCEATLRWKGVTRSLTICTALNQSRHMGKWRFIRRTVIVIHDTCMQTCACSRCLGPVCEGAGPSLRDATRAVLAIGFIGVAVVFVLALAGAVVIDVFIFPVVVSVAPCVPDVAVVVGLIVLLALPLL